MLIKAKQLNNFKMNSLDGEIGKVKEFYFDDQYWILRYLVADSGNWLTGRQVLISPNALGSIDTVKKNIHVNLTKKQIEDSPSLDSETAVSRQFEENYYTYYGWPIYWTAPYLIGSSPTVMPEPQKWIKRRIHDDQVWDHHLRSTHEVSGYNVQALNGEIGHIDDFIIDDEMWNIRYLIIDTAHWWQGKKVLVSPQWVNDISWDEGKVFINFSEEIIKKSPEYSEETLIIRDYEDRLHQHYSQPGYWTEKPLAHTLF